MSRVAMLIDWTAETAQQPRERVERQIRAAMAEAERAERAAHAADREHSAAQDDIHEQLVADVAWSAAFDAAMDVAGERPPYGL